MKAIKRYVVKPEFEKFAEALWQTVYSDDKANEFQTNSIAMEFYQTAGVLNTWFEPEYQKEDEYKAGMVVVVTSWHYTNIPTPQLGTIMSINDSDEPGETPYKIKLTYPINANDINHIWSFKYGEFHLATLEEINALDIINKFNVGQWVEWTEDHTIGRIKTKSLKYYELDVFGHPDGYNSCMGTKLRALSFGEIKSYLVKEANKRGYKEGTPVHSLIHNRKLICKHTNKDTIYAGNLDKLHFGTDDDRWVVIYEKGEWAKILKPTVLQFGRKDVHILPGKIEVDGFPIHKETIEKILSPFLYAKLDRYQVSYPAGDQLLIKIGCEVGTLGQALAIWNALQ